MSELEDEGIGWIRNLLGGSTVLLALLLLAGCGAKHTVGDYVIHDPAEEESGGTEQEGAKSKQKASSEPAQEQAAQEAQSESVGEAEPDEAVNRYMEAEGTSYGGEEWAAEVHNDGDRYWLETPLDPAATYATVRAASRMQGLPIAGENREERRFRTKKAFRGWQGGSETGVGLFMKVLTKGFGKDARYTFEVQVKPQESGEGSRVTVKQDREVQKGDRTQDVGDWVPADTPDPEITRDYVQALQRAFGEKGAG